MQPKSWFFGLWKLDTENNSDTEERDRHNANFTTTWFSEIVQNRPEWQTPLQSRRFHQAGQPDAPERCSWDEWVHNEHDPSIPESGVVLLCEGIWNSGPDENQNVRQEF